MEHWFRVHHGMPFDPKWQLVASRSGQPRHMILAVWAALLDCASQADDRGSVADFDVETVAVALDAEQGAVEAVITAMRCLSRPMIDADNRIPSWPKRQPKREDNSTDRVRAHRAKAAGVTGGGNGNGTHGAAAERDVTHGNARGEERREEEKRVSTPLPPPHRAAPAPDPEASTPATTPAGELRRAFLQLRDRHWPHTSRLPAPTMTIECHAEQLLADGAPVALLAELLDRAMAKAAGRNRSPPNSLNAYSETLRDGIASWRAGRIATPTPTATGPLTAERWLAYTPEVLAGLARRYRDEGHWLRDAWGPPPDDPGSTFPAEVAKQAGIERLVVH